ncbi:MAG: hypothetical protein K2Y18_05160 [Alphaproteobacteria bacterium]|jgi:hypothetical protein|nr:hypothetical protein [Alphaproteobacteria bacterium]
MMIWVSMNGGSDGITFNFHLYTSVYLDWRIHLKYLSVIASPPYDLEESGMRGNSKAAGVIQMWYAVRKGAMNPCLAPELLRRMRSSQ